MSDNYQNLYIVVGSESCDCCGHYRSFVIDSIHLTRKEAAERIIYLEDSETFAYYPTNYEWDIEYDNYLLKGMRIEVDECE